MISSSTTPQHIQRCIHLFTTHFPGVGPKTAEKIAFYLAKCLPGEIVAEIAQAILNLHLEGDRCQVCGATTEKPQAKCAVCRDESRDHSVVCVVEKEMIMRQIERMRQFTGVYHIIGGVISSTTTVEALNLTPLIRRVASGQVKEVVLAIRSDIHGTYTANYIAETVKIYGVKVTRLSEGLPFNVDLEDAPEGAIAAALKNRTEIAG